MVWPQRVLNCWTHHSSCPGYSGCASCVLIVSRRLRIHVYTVSCCFWCHGDLPIPALFPLVTGEPNTSCLTALQSDTSACWTNSVSFTTTYVTQKSIGFMLLPVVPAAASHMNHSFPSRGKFELKMKSDPEALQGFLFHSFHPVVICEIHRDPTSVKDIWHFWHWKSRT